MPNSASLCLPDHGVSPPCSLPLLGLLILAIPVRIRWYFMVVLMRIFLMIKYGEIFSCSCNFWFSVFNYYWIFCTPFLSSPKNIVTDLGEKHLSVASGTCPNQGSNSLPTYVPWLAIKPTAFQCTGWPSNKRGHRPGLHIFCIGLFAGIFYAFWLLVLPVPCAAGVPSCGTWTFTPNYSLVNRSSIQLHLLFFFGLCCLCEAKITKLFFYV